MKDGKPIPFTRAEQNEADSKCKRSDYEVLSSTILQYSRIKIDEIEITPNCQRGELMHISPALHLVLYSTIQYSTVPYHTIQYSVQLNVNPVLYQSIPFPRPWIYCPVLYSPRGIPRSSSLLVLYRPNP